MKSLCSIIVVLFVLRALSMITAVGFEVVDLKILYLCMFTVCVVCVNNFSMNQWLRI